MVSVLWGLMASKSQQNTIKSYQGIILINSKNYELFFTEFLDNACINTSYFYNYSTKFYFDKVNTL